MPINDELYNDNFQNADYHHPIKSKSGKFHLRSQWKKHVSLFNQNNFKTASWAKVGSELATLTVALSPLAIGALSAVAPFAAIGLVPIVAFAFKQASIREIGEQKLSGQIGYNGKRVLKNTARYLIQPW